MHFPAVKTVEAEAVRDPRALVRRLRSEIGAKKPSGGVPEGGFIDQFLYARYRKVTTWARLQMALGPKVVAVRPAVMLFSTAHSMAW